MGDKNIINIIKTNNYIRKEKNKKYFKLNGLTTWIGAQRKWENIKFSKIRNRNYKRISFNKSNNKCRNKRTTNRNRSKKLYNR